MFQKNISLLPYNTFHFDCKAKYFIEISKISELDELLKTKIFADNKRLILGGGANILLTKETFDGLVIKNTLLGKEIIKETDTQSMIKVGAGENRDDFVQRTIEQGYCGLENLVAIPGSVGAAPIQNIGAYGVEVGGSIAEVSCKVLTKKLGQVQKNTTELKPIKIGSLLSLNKKQCNFGYRDSIFKQALQKKVIITHVTFILEKYNPKTYTPNIQYGAIQEKLSHHIPSTKTQAKKMTIHEKEVNISTSQYNKSISKRLSPHLIATVISEIRASKLPDTKKLGTAGSFFKNPIITKTQFQTLQKKYPELKGFPVNPPLLQRKGLGERGKMIKLSAGQLIDLVIGKNWRIGQVGTYEKHALVLVHHGGGKGSEIVTLSTEIQKRVQEKFGISISPEVNFIG